ncbi:DUF3168 domain-containing protein [Brucella sp. 6810]|uniref:DUF3168 domain-containing protein n=1 Tax=Brucella sp. 6810 TaxID=2769351 RepID=UPI00165C2AFD|nr:DUF3168 domain-containing protein [Brucella sp. 6810]QNQ63105.1 DUF3168 domain-containing protein [Brucella sp. 6810]
MLEPTLALQTAVRTALINTPDLTALVEPRNIRSGSTRPDNLPCLILSGIASEHLGYAAGLQQVARVLLDLHIWALDDGIDTAWQIGFAACNCLFDAPPTDGFAIDEWHRPAVRWMRDPDPEKSLCHGVVSLEAIIRWRL